MGKKKKSKKKSIFINKSQYELKKEIKSRVAKELSKDISNHPQVQKLTLEIFYSMVYFFMLAEKSEHRFGKQRLFKTISRAIDLAQSSDLSSKSLSDLATQVKEVSGFDLGDIPSNYINKDTK